MKTPVLSAAGRGVVGAMAMSAVRNVTTDLGLVLRTPPDQIATEEVPALLARVPPDRRQSAVELAHWGYGAAGGAAFGVLPEPVRHWRWIGPAYGLAVWLLFELVLAPALGLSQSRGLKPAQRAALAADHVLYGVVVAHRPSSEFLL